MTDIRILIYTVMIGLWCITYQLYKLTKYVQELITSVYTIESEVVFLKYEISREKSDANRK